MFPNSHRVGKKPDKRNTKRFNYSISACSCLIVMSDICSLLKALAELSPKNETETQMILNI